MYSQKQENNGLGTRRSKLVIIAEILYAASGGAKKTYIMRRVGMNYGQLGRYMTELSECGLLRINEKNGCETTPKGDEFLEGYRLMVDLMKDEESSPTLPVLKRNNNGGVTISNRRS